MASDSWWYFRAIALFVLFNSVALVGVLLFRRSKWNVTVTRAHHYTSLIFQICGVIYALFVGFIVWDGSAFTK